MSCDHTQSSIASETTILGRSVFFRDDALAPRGASTPLWELNHALSQDCGPQPNPSCPALCRQDTTSPWSTDFGGNVES